MPRRPFLVAAAVALAALALPARGGGAGPPPDNPLFARIADLQVVRAREYRALLVVPLAASAGDPEATVPFTPAMEAAEADLFSAAEPEGKEGRAQIELYNWSATPVLAPAGLLLAGGARDRFLPRTVLLAPGTKISLRVYPADRQPRKAAERSRLLEPEPRTVPHLLRLLGLAGGSPAQVDGFLEEAYVLAGIQPDRQPLATLYRLGPIAEKLAEYLPLFGALPAEAGGRVTGAAIYVGDRFLSIDLFGRCADFRASWPALLAAAAFEAAAYEVSFGLVNAPFPAARDPERFREEVTRILRRPFGTAHREEKAAGLGREFTFRRGEYAGRTLALDGALVHALILRDVLNEPEPAPPTAGTPSEETYGDLERRAERGRLTEFEKRLLERMRQRRGIPEGD